MSIQKFSLLAIGTIISGCATTYVEQSSGDLARVRFVAKNSGAPTAVNLYSEKNCENKIPVTSLLGRSIELFPIEKRLGIPLWDYSANAAKEFNMPANVEQNIMIIQNTGGLSSIACGAYFQFTYEKNNDYEIIFDSQKCTATIYKINGTVENAKRELINTYSSSSNVSQSCITEFKNNAR
ncbi:hypothetical protein G3485_09650 [Shewanella baltica]|uniref:hypothetical protein n=1 Tax=Shewanella baltica TaxID=62322 RepID=UPI0001883F30|nr:hypothetical protein [Shewanella baltica]ACK48094.1 hypothetical protein Sbal223_3615 [Shewanella baltica OS223]MCS6116583.1 hypothetical protein [Shewanella baltica]MCS6127257.1 hypothetical protein [Shewanella baltica]MCS6139330.1 hypothetical protein [Shewanella baltica]MCS6145589.1 hypothetical protein [Shewanella baltica]